MDTLREKVMLNELWNNGKAPWKVGNEYGFLARPIGLSDWPHRLQGRLDGAMAF
jgi:hypothetical protein